MATQQVSRDLLLLVIWLFGFTRKKKKKLTLKHNCFQYFGNYVHCSRLLRFSVEVQIVTRP